ncbi:MAG: tocopherol cyclase family protein [Faecousia sp.]
MRTYFCGRYFRCQSETQTLALIPAIHRAGGEQACSIQLLTEEASQNVVFPAAAFRKRKGCIAIGENQFGEKGISLHLHTDTLTAEGNLRFGTFTPLRYDIMGPFRYVPFMECRHSVFSMRHTVNGELQINGKRYTFRDGSGYCEGDRGRSFPKAYAWTQCSLPGGALMLSVADIPFGICNFTGVIGAILWKGKEYRLATYLGARAVRIEDGTIIVRQGAQQLTVQQLGSAAAPLRAPLGGKMLRTIHEHAACRVYYHFQIGGATVFALEAPNAALEFEYGRNSESSR